MNCQIFSDLVSDVARNQIMDASAQTQALAHAFECLPCAQRLKTEQRLTSDLWELASESKDWTSSTTVWSELSAAFDARSVTPAAPRRRWLYAAASIAAMSLLAFAVFSINRRPRPATGMEVSIAAPAVSVRAHENNYAPKAERRENVIAIVRKKPQINQPRQPEVSRRSASPLNQAREIVTDFIPLTYGDTAVGSDAQIVRMELPRSAMATFGLPVNVDRSDQRVKADVLLGADGLAHAIRFVQ